MTVDPSQVPAGDPPAETPQETPTPPPAPTIDLDAVAEKVVAKLLSAVPETTGAPEAQTQTYNAQNDPIAMLKAQAADPQHPLYATATATLQVLRNQGEEQEWAALGAGPGHPARALFAQNPQAYSGYPRFAFTAWELQEARKSQNDEARKKAKQDEEREAAEQVRQSVPAMPPRSVNQKPRSGGRISLTHAEFEARVVNEPELDDLADKGLIDWKQ